MPPLAPRSQRAPNAPLAGRRLALALVCLLIWFHHGHADDSSLGLRLPAGFGSASTNDNRRLAVVDVMDFYRSVPPGPYPQVWGVFVGITNYAAPSYRGLRNCVRDAQDLAQTMRERCGLRDPVVLLDQNATLAGLEEALRIVGQKSGPGDLFVFHFSGHGLGLTSAQEKGGYMLLHDCPPPDRFALGTGVLPMNLLQRLAARQGIQAKHQLYILDCCYSGMGTYARTLVSRGGSLPTSAEARNIEDMLAQPAQYVISAGGAGQPVLDGPAESGGGHGLLSGFLIQALRSPSEFNLHPQAVAGQDLLALPKLYTQANETIRTQARAAIEKVYRSWTNTHADRLTSRDGNPYANYFERMARPSEIFKLVQNPQQGLLETEGWVYLPLRRDPATIATTVPAAAPPATTNNPSGAPPASPEAWLQQLAETYPAATNYPPMLRRVFDLLRTGPPSANASTNQPIALEAEVWRRPRVEHSILDAWFPASSYLGREPSSPDDRRRVQSARAIDLQRWRKATPGADWVALPFTGGWASSHYEVRLTLAQHGRDPVYYYVFLLDEAGLFQWLAPANNSWKDNELGPSQGRLTSGSTPLQPERNHFALPAVADVAGTPIEQGWSVQEDDLDLAWFVVATPAPWPELEEALFAASRQAFDQFETTPPTPRKRLTSALPAAPTGARALGRWETLPTDAKPGETSLPVQPALLHRAERGWLLLHWTLDVLPAAKARPLLHRPRASDEP